MKDKCEWKDGEFFGCRDHGFTITGKSPIDTYYGRKVSFCPFCGADIRKPEPEVIIRKSGGTYSILWENTNYLVLEPDSQYFDPDGDNDYSRLLYDDVIKPISEIKITDEIAKLRPMVVPCTEITHCEWKDLPIEKLVYAECDDGDSWDYITDLNNRYFVLRLATVSDLEE